MPDMWRATRSPDLETGTMTAGSADFAGATIALILTVWACIDWITRQ
jgi:hypothetical protein